MNSIGILANDIDLINHFKASNVFEEVVEMKDLQDAVMDVLLISDRIMSTSELKEKRQILRGKKCFYMVSSAHFTNMSEALVQSSGIIMVPPKLTVSQVQAFVHKKLQSTLVYKSKVFTFFGADSKVGTSMVAHSVAKLLSNKRENVLFLPLDGRTGDDYTKFDSKYGLDDIKTKLHTKVLSRSEIEELCVISSGGYKVLPGIRNLLLRRHFHPEHISHLIDVLENFYDVVIIDAGANLELGMTIASLNCTPNKFLIGTQQDLIMNRFKGMKGQILDKLGIDQFLLIVNHFHDLSELYSKSELEKTYESPVVSTLPYMEYGWQCEQDQTTLLDYKNADYIYGINQICEVITAHLGIEWKTEEKVKRSILSRLFKNKKEVEVYGTAL